RKSQIENRMAKPRRPTTRRASSGKPENTPKPHKKRGGLSEYEQKRDFSATPEPAPGAGDRARSSHPGSEAVKISAKAKAKAAESSATSALFVIQKHDARRLH